MAGLVVVPGCGNGDDKYIAATRRSAGDEIGPHRRVMQQLLQFLFIEHHRAFVNGANDVLVDVHADNSQAGLGPHEGRRQTNVTGANDYDLL